MKEVISPRRSGHTMNAAYCGLDVHKESTYATVLDHTGQVVTQKRMRNEEVPEFLEPLQVEKVAMEASTYIIPMYRRLLDEGYEVTVSHPKKTRYIAEARIKSDRVDSKALAELLRLDSLSTSYIPPRAARTQLVQFINRFLFHQPSSFLSALQSSHSSGITCTQVPL